MIEERTAVRRRVLTATSVSYVVVILDTTVVNVGLDRVAAALSASIEGLQWVVNAYTLSFAALLLTGGLLGDRWGARRAYLVGLAVFTAASALCAITTSLAGLITARAMQGIGAALLVPGSLKLIDRASPDPGQRARAVGLWVVCGAVAMAAGPLIGGVLIDLFGWRSIFLVNLPIGLAGIALTWRVPGDGPRRRDQPFDLLGQFTAIVGLVALIEVTIEGRTVGLTSPLVLAGMVLVPIAFVAFVVIERRQASPMLPPRLFRNAVFTGSVLASAASAFIFYGLLFVLSLAAQRIAGLTPLGTGLALLPMTAMVAVGSLTAAPITRGLGLRCAMGAAFALYAAGALGLLVGAALPAWHALPALLAIGLASGFISPAATAPALGSVEAARVGIAAGALNAARQIGAALGVAVFGSLTAAFPGEAGLRLALWLVVLAAGASASAWGLSRLRFI